MEVSEPRRATLRLKTDNTRVGVQCTSDGLEASSAPLEKQQGSQAEGPVQAMTLACQTASGTELPVLGEGWVPQGSMSFSAE